MATMYNPPHLGELIRESIEAEGWSVTETAERLGVGRVALSRVLNGHAGPRAVRPPKGSFADLSAPRIRYGLPCSMRW